MHACPHEAAMITGIEQRKGLRRLAIGLGITGFDGCVLWSKRLWPLSKKLCPLE